MQPETQITTTIYIEGSVSNMGRSGSQNNIQTGRREPIQMPIWWL